MILCNNQCVPFSVVDTRKPQYLTFAKATPSKQFLMNDSQQKENNNILLNPVKAGGGGGGITNASTGIMELVSQSSDFVPTTAYCKPEKINPDAGKLNILEPVRSMLPRHVYYNRFCKNRIMLVIFTHLSACLLSLGARLI